jgi:hypothetical protein|tara:strand:+ start:205 stop:1548 length:1344 start_codon:yes stop_codon:yes gene_type:complete
VKLARKILGLLLFINLTIEAQEIRIPDNVLYSYNSEGFIYLFTKNEILEIDLLTYKTSLIVMFGNNKFDLNMYTPIKIKDVFYWVHRSGGIVLKLTNKSLTRIDNSYNHKMQYGGAVFQYENNIYRYGGYGFFSERDFIVKYDFQTNEWESINITSSLSPIGRFDFAHTIKEDLFVIIGGNKVDPLNRKERLSLEDSWGFSFEEMSWSPILSTKHFNNFNSTFFNIDNKIGVRSKKEFLLYDYESFTFEIYDINNTILKLDKRFKIHLHNNKYHFIVNRNNSEKVLINRTKKEFFGNLKSSKKINENNYLIWFVVFLSVFSLILIHNYFNKYLNSVVLYRNKIKHKRNVIRISNEEYLILSEFISNSNIIENNQIQRLLDKEQYDRSHNIRLKNNLIESLNSKFKYLISDESKQYIETQKSKYDKRYKRYFLNIGQLYFVNKRNTLR